MSPITLLTLPPNIAALVGEIPKLNSSNWSEFKSAMEMLFLGSGADYLLDAKSNTTVPPDCTKIDKQLVFYIWARVDDEFRFLVQDARTSALQAWLALLGHFQRSTMPRRIAAREQLYSIQHDPTKSIDVFIHSLTSAAKALSDLGCKVEDTEIKDLLLMKLHDSFLSVRTSILTAREEPDLEAVKALLFSSSSSVPPPDSYAMASYVSHKHRSQSHHQHQQNHHSSPSPTSSSNDLSPDNKGFYWCNTSNNDNCHRCGRPNHIAAHCLFNMPTYVKDWVMKGGYKEQARMAIISADDDFEYSAAANTIVEYPGNVQSLESVEMAGNIMPPGYFRKTGR